jgi:hypothetical protein
MITCIQRVLSIELSKSIFQVVANGVFQDDYVYSACFIPRIVEIHF